MKGRSDAPWADLIGDTAPPPWRRRGVLLGCLVLIAATGVLVLLGREPADPRYRTAPVVVRDLTVSVTAIGNLQPVEQVDVGAETSGRVVAVMADVNDRVNVDQPLAQIDPARLVEELRRAQAAARAADAQVDAARAAADLSRVELRRLEEVARLSGGRIPAAAELDRVRAETRRADAQVRVAQAQAAQAQADAAATQTNLARATILSPVTGVVLSRQVDPGQTVAATFQTPVLFTIANDLARLRLDVRVDEADIAQVREGQPATFGVDAYPGASFPAAVVRVELGATGSGGTQPSGGGGEVVSYTARLLVENPDGRLRPGMTATATIVTEQIQGHFVVPLEALRFRPPVPESGALSVRRPEGEEERRQETRIGRGSRQQIHVLEEAGVRTLAVTVVAVVGGAAAVTGDGLAAGLPVILEQFGARP